MNDDDLSDPLFSAVHSVHYTYSTTHGGKRVDHSFHRRLHTHQQGEQKGGHKGEESGTGSKGGLFTHI